MANANSIQEAKDIAGRVPQNITAADTTPWIVIQYVPALGTSGAAAVVTVAAATIDFFVDAASTSGLDTIGNGTTSSALTTTDTFDTMGELVDHINSRPAWRAYLVGALRADNPSDLLAASSTDVIGANGGVFYSDTTSTLEVSTAISGEKFINNGINGHVTDWDSQCLNDLMSGAFTLGDGTGAITLKFYTGKAGSAEVQTGPSITLTEDTQKLVGDSDGNAPYMSSLPGERLIIRATTDSAFDAYTEFSVVGRTAVLDGSRLVRADNY